MAFPVSRHSAQNPPLCGKKHTRNHPVVLVDNKSQILLSRLTILHVVTVQHRVMGTLHSLDNVDWEENTKETQLLVLSLALIDS